jgi:hypothetical protein
MAFCLLAAALLFGVILRPRRRAMDEQRPPLRVERRRGFVIGDFEGPLEASALAEREGYVDEAKQAEYLDAVFLIRYYNAHRLRWGPPPKPPEIDPVEVFGVRFDRAKFSDGVDRVDGLLRDATAVAMAEFGYPEATRTADEEMRLLKQRYSGFSDRAFEHALHSASVAMR